MKKWSHLGSFHVPFLAKVHFFNFVLTSSKNISIFKQLTYMHLKGLVMHFQKMLLFTVPWLCFEDFSFWNRRNLLNFCWVGIVFDILIANISWTVAQTPINQIIFCKTVIRTFRSIYVNYFDRLRFLAEVSTKLRKMHFFWTISGP